MELKIFYIYKDTDRYRSIEDVHAWVSTHRYISQLYPLRGPRSRYFSSSKHTFTLEYWFLSIILQ